MERKKLTAIDGNYLSPNIVKNNFPNFQITHGRRFGKWVVLSYQYHSNGRDFWLCRCDCGIERICNGKNLRKNLSTSCGCKGVETRRERDNLVGKKFTRLLVVSVSSVEKETIYNCLCDCGNLCKITAGKLSYGHTKSCGCLLREKSSERAIVRNKKMSQERHPKWRHDLTQEDRLNQRNRNFDPRSYRWRIKVYKKYSYTCQKCQTKSPRCLRAHHIYSWNTHPKLRFLVSNGILFCEECHKLFHSLFGYGYNTKKQLNKFLQIT